MRQTVSALLCILAIITGANALGPQLSPSFSFEGTAVLTQTTGATVTTTTFTRYNLAIDATRELLYGNIEAMIADATFSIYALASVNDQSAYVVTNGVCSESTYIANASDQMSFRVNFWGSFDNAVVNSPDTYVVTESSTVSTLLTTNGLPVSYNVSFTGFSFALTITNYINSAPQFSTFTLPAACSQSTCNACYSSAVNLGSSFILMLLALVALAVMYSTV